MNRDEKPGGIQISGCDLAGLAGEVLAKGVPLRFKATGFSMTPVIKDGDTVTVSPCPFAKLRRGDVAAFIHPTGNCLVVHRIVGRRDGAFLIKGDNAKDIDGLIPWSRVLGRVTCIERNGSYAVLGLGAERRMLALFSRIGLLSFVLNLLRSLCGPRALRTPMV
jgi:signal peptidase I